MSRLWVRESNLEPLVYPAVFVDAGVFQMRVREVRGEIGDGLRRGECGVLLFRDYRDVADVTGQVSPVARQLCTPPILGTGELVFSADRLHVEIQHEDVRWPDPLRSQRR